MNVTERYARHTKDSLIEHGFYHIRNFKGWRYKVTNQAIFRELDTEYHKGGVPTIAVEAMYKLTGEFWKRYYKDIETGQNVPLDVYEGHLMGYISKRVVSKDSNFLYSVVDKTSYKGYMDTAVKTSDYLDAHTYYAVKPSKFQGLTVSNFDDIPTHDAHFMSKTPEHVYSEMEKKLDNFTVELMDMAKLTDKQKVVIALYLGLWGAPPYKDDEGKPLVTKMGERLRMTKQSVSNIISRALANLEKLGKELDQKGHDYNSFKRRLDKYKVEEN